MQDPIVIVSAARTPIGGFQGELSDCTAPDLGAICIRSAYQDAEINPSDIDEVLMGCVLPAGLGQAPARQAALLGGLPENTPCSTVNKVCGSGMKTVMLAHDQLKAGNGNILVAGGMESMTNAPYMLPKMRGGARLGHNKVVDHMFFDGLEDAYDKGTLMGTFAEECAEKYQFTRQEQDEYALSSLEYATNAQSSGAFENEITEVTVKTRKGEKGVKEDEQPKVARPDKIPLLKPAFKANGTVTAANSSSISDGAAALILMRESDAKAKGLKIRARICGHASYASAPKWFTTAPISAISKLLTDLNWAPSDVDLWEINEAFAVVPMAAQKELGLSRNKLNVNGGACALGHPIGASGTRVIVTLLNALEWYNKKRGIASLCIGGGEATALAIETLH